MNEGFEDLASCENIEYLDLKGNKIQTVEQLMPLTKLPNLKRLELLNCEIASMDNYREQIFKLFPNLEFLDGLDKEGHECAEGNIKYKISNNGIFLIKFFFQDQECENDESEEDSEEEGDESHEVGLSYLNKEGM